MTDQQIDEMHELAMRLVRVTCCEFHAHSARRGCLSGPPMSVSVCVLCEELKAIRTGIRRLSESTEPDKAPAT